MLGIGIQAEKSVINPQFVRAIEAIYAAATSPTTWPGALQEIANCTEDAGAILIYGRDDGSFGVINSPSLDECVVEYGANWSLRDTRANRSRERGYFVGRDVITDRDVVTPQEVVSDPFYSDFLRRYGLRYFAAAMVSPDPHVEVALSIQRPIEKPEYSESELDLIARLGPHVEKSLRLSLRLMDAELLNVGLGTALSRIGIGVFALDSLGRVVFSNVAGDKLLGDGLDIANDRLTFGASAETAGTANAAIRAVVDGKTSDLSANPSPILVQRSHSLRPLAIYVLPIDLPDNPVNAMLTHARAIVLAIDSENSEPPDASIVRDALGLTLGEARIASLVGSGMQTRDAANKLGINEETARSALKRVFQKVGVSRQSELAALMTKLVLR